MLSRVPITSEMVQVLVCDQLLGVAQPHVGAVGQAGNLQQVGKLGWVGLLSMPRTKWVPSSGRDKVPVSDRPGPPAHPQSGSGS